MRGWGGGKRGDATGKKLGLPIPAKQAATTTAPEQPLHAPSNQVARTGCMGPPTQRGSRKGGKGRARTIVQRVTLCVEFMAGYTGVMMGISDFLHAREGSQLKHSPSPATWAHGHIASSNAARVGTWRLTLPVSVIQWVPHRQAHAWVVLLRHKVHGVRPAPVLGGEVLRSSRGKEGGGLAAVSD